MRFFVTGEGSMRHFAVAFLTIFSAVALAACGDTGDHFLEFRQAPPAPAVVQKLVLAMPLIASKKTQHADLKLYVTAYGTDGNALAQGTTLANPITIHSNWTGLTMLVKGKQVTSAAFGSAPATIYVTYSAPPKPCSPAVSFSAFNQNANPQTVVLEAVKC
jgi:hypothetical protein